MKTHERCESKDCRTDPIGYWFESFSPLGEGLVMRVYGAIQNWINESMDQ